MLGLITSNPAVEPPPNALRAQAALRDADWALRSMHFGICWNYNRKAEVSHFDAAFHRLARQLDARYHLPVARREIILDDRRDCDESDSYASYSIQYVKAIMVARQALGLED